MKTIQIPTTSNPFIVNINNHAYSYAAGEIVEVPDDVAEVIECHMDAQPTAQSAEQPSATPRTGGATKEWQRLIDAELTEETNIVTANVDVNGNAFEVSELFFRVYMPAKADGDTVAYFRVGQAAKGHNYAFNQTQVLYLGVNVVVADGVMYHISGCRSTSNEFTLNIAHPYGGYCNGIAMGTNKLTSITAGLTNDKLKMPVGTKITVFGR